MPFANYDTLLSALQGNESVIKPDAIMNATKAYYDDHRRVSLCVTYTIVAHSTFELIIKFDSKSRTWHFMCEHCRIN